MISNKEETEWTIYWSDSKAGYCYVESKSEASLRVKGIVKTSFVGTRDAVKKEVKRLEIADGIVIPGGIRLALGYPARKAKGTH